MSNNKFELNDVYQTVLNLNPRERKATNLKIGALKLQFLFDIEKFSTKVTIVSAVSVLMGICNFFLLERTGLYSLGINSVFQAIARCVSYFLSKANMDNVVRVVHPFLFWSLTFLINIPLAILGYKKVGRNFTLLSLTSILVSTATSIFLSSLPQAWGLKDFYIFSDPKTFHTCLTDKRINILQWNYITQFTQNGSSGGTNNNTSFLNDSSNVTLMFLYGFIFGFLNSMFSLVIYSLGGSSGGIDWLVFYLAKKRFNSTNNLFLYFGIAITFLSYFLGTYIPYLDYIGSNHSCNSTFSINGVQWKLSGTYSNFKNGAIISNLIGPVFVATMIAAFTKRFFFNIFYPYFKLINVKIFTNKFLQLRNAILQSDFPHSFTINTALGGYLLRRQMVFEITCFALELKKLIEYSKSIDPDCLITTSPIKSLSGKFMVIDRID